jgi:hypothetical protein
MSVKSGHMLRTTVTCLLIPMLVMGALPAVAAEPTVSEQLAKLKVGRKIRIVLNSGETLKGLRGSIGADQFDLEPRGGAPQTARVVRFNEVRSVKTDGLTTGQKWATFAVAWVAVAIVAKLTI